MRNNKKLIFKQEPAMEKAQDAEVLIFCWDPKRELHKPERNTILHSFPLNFWRKRAFRKLSFRELDFYFYKSGSDKQVIEMSFQIITTNLHSQVFVQSLHCKKKLH